MAKTNETASTITFSVTKEGDWYLAQADEFSTFTEAKSLDQLKTNIREVCPCTWMTASMKSTGCRSGLQSK